MDNFTRGLIGRLQEFSANPKQANAGQSENSSATLAPLHIRLERLLDTIPQSQKQEGLSLSELQSCLRGRKGRLPHIGEMGDAMRKLGWRRRRAWSKANSAFSSKWYPFGVGHSDANTE